MSRKVLIALLVCLNLFLCGCAITYRLPPYGPPSTEAIRIVATAPEQYVVSLDMGGTTDLSVPKDGRMRIIIPAYHTCSVYLFNVIRVHQGNTPLKEWNITVSRDGEIVRKVSLSKLRKLPTDQTGYRILKISN